MIANWNYSRFFVCRHEIFLYSISKISFPPFGNRWHITRTKMNRQIFKYKCLLRSASKLKRGVIVGTGGCFWFSVFVDFSSPIFFVVFVCCQFWWGHCPWIVFSQIYFTFFMIYASRLSFYEPFYSMWSSVYVPCWFFFLSTRCQYYMNYWTHTPLTK